MERATPPAGWARCWRWCRASGDGKLRGCGCVVERSDRRGCVRAHSERGDGEARTGLAAGNIDNARRLRS